MEVTMKSILSSTVVLFALLGGTAYAATQYNDPGKDPQYKQCQDWASKRYEGGDEKSPVAGQTKVQAFCTCMWNETPDDFKGNLIVFSESEKGASVNKMCEKHADWGS
jgi:hypothetical protein